jgi:nitrite reductase/ring-hydroxylating ferredoxin subunit
VNLLLRPASGGRHPSADGSDWADTWVCVGFVEQLTEVGAVLPATIGYHAAHVVRTPGGLRAAINARPFGGCMSVPVHCASTQNIRCPHLACAFSAHGGVLDSTNDPRGRARAEFLGDGRRVVEVPLTQWGSLVFVNITLTAPDALSLPGAPPGGTLVADGSQLVSGNWLGSPVRAAVAVTAALGGGDVIAVSPNVVVIRDLSVSGADTFAIHSRPAGHTRSTVVWAVFGDQDTDSTDVAQRVTAILAHGDVG